MYKLLSSPFDQDLPFPLDIPGYLVWAQQPSAPWPTKHQWSGTLQVGYQVLHVVHPWMRFLFLVEFKT
jgi:hypothetical protein